MTDRHGSHGPDHGLERLIFFSDAVFAIAITLLIIEVHVPELEGSATDAQWIAALFHLFPSFSAFALSFIVIGAIWTSHHATLSMLSQFDRSLIWPNMLMLMAIAFLPFSTALLSRGSLSIVPYVFYSASLLIAALLKTRLTLVALRPELISSGVPQQAVVVERRLAWVMPIVSAAAVILSAFVAQWGMLALLGIPIARRLPFFRRPDF
ncbi:Uncharacterized membrane protein [Sphingomonas sp. YR710]|uniref:TMEM175 family protein n=1 Tax=Sphingomonas sp. YR710 TaxID=1882773 RepID=UPI0008815E00|nr:TMEM175 family protein [Sphingomonas sp. YR710]SDC84082.1 Uncharacterized membrane protein [Sphingomonas sp. YR710]